MKAALSSTADSIAAIALRLLERRGPDAVTMRAVAAAAKVTPMAIYHHFANRDALLQQITDQEFDRLHDAMQARLAKLAGSRNYRAKLTELMQGYIDYALERPHVFDFVFSRERPGARKYPEDFHARRSPTLNVLADTLADGMQAGVLAKADVWEIAMQFWALVHGYVALYRASRFELSPKAFRELCDRSIDRLFDGLCK